MRRLILAAALAAATSSLALVPAMANINNDNAGVDDLGVDISSVVLTPASVHAFVNGLAPEVRHDVQAACANYNKNPAGMDVQTLSFCADLGKA